MTRLQLESLLERAAHTLIPLSAGKFAIVDTEDFEYLNQWKWSYSGAGYARRVVQKNNNQTNIYMHRLISKTPARMVTDHINGDKLDNRKSNLRVCNHAQNIRNHKLQINNTSGFIGVSKTKGGRWRAYSGSRNKVQHLGVFDSSVEAAKARDEYVSVHYNGFEVLNFNKEKSYV